MRSQTRLKVWIVNRLDSSRAAGGDTIQMVKTTEALGVLGVNVELKLSRELPQGPWGCDLVHVFNIQTAEQSWEVCNGARNRGLPLVVSPIYWDPLPEWFSQAPRKNAVWNLVRKGLGPRLGFRLYRFWQRRRYPTQARWRRQRCILQMADGLLPNSTAESRQLMSDFRLAASTAGRVHVVPNAVDRRLFAELPRPCPRLSAKLASGKAVLQVGRIAPEKNPMGLLEALWDLPVPLIFVGDASPHHPEYAETFRRRASERGDVHLIPWVEHEDLPGVYAAATVHVLPSWRETPGLASLEAAAAGCRVVSTSLGSAGEYLGEDAWYCHPADPGSIRRATLAALEAPASDRLRRRVLQNYSWEAAARATLAAYERVLRQGSERTAEQPEVSPEKTTGHPCLSSFGPFAGTGS